MRIDTYLYYLLLICTDKIGFSFVVSHSVTVFYRLKGLLSILIIYYILIYAVVLLNSAPFALMMHICNPYLAFGCLQWYQRLSCTHMHSLRPYIWIQATLGHSQEYLRTRHRSDSWCNILTGWARFHCFHFMSIYKVCFLAVYSSVFKLLTAGPGIQCISDRELFLPILSLHSGTSLLCFRAQDIRCGALRCLLWLRMHNPPHFMNFHDVAVSSFS